MGFASVLRRRAPWLSLWLLLLGLLAPAEVSAASAAPSVFRFAHLADAHWVGGAENRTTRQVLAAMAAHQPQMLVLGGDVTEAGAGKEYAEYLAAQTTALPGVPAQAVPGNHDARWLDAGKALFRANLGDGRTYRSFSRAGVHFVLLDSTVEAATHGHFDATQLAWLTADLQALPKNTPVLVFFHHPLGYTPLTFMDSEAELLDVLAPFNVRGVFTGHGHLHMRWQRNGIPFFMTQAADEGGYKLLEITGDRLRVFDGALEAAPKLVLDLPLAGPPARSYLRFDGLQELTPGRWQLTAKAALPADVRVWYQVNSGSWFAMTATGATSGAAGGATVFQATVATAQLTPGRHRIHLWAAPVGAQYPGLVLTKAQWEARDAGPAWTDVHDFDLPASSGGAAATVAWQYRTQGGIQAAPAVGPDRVYVGSRDGSVTGLDPANGTALWVHRLPGPIVGSPALSVDRLAAADTLGNVVALDARTGQVLWTYRHAAPVLAEPLWAAQMLMIADAQGQVTALDRITGARRWQTQVAGGAIRARPVFANGFLYLGAWDRSIHALDVFTGKERWQRALPGSVYFSPANQPPLYFRGRLFVTRSQPTGGAGLYALDAGDGRVLWAARGGFGYSAPVLHGGQVVVTSGGGTVTAFDPLTGRQAWAAETGVESFDGALSSHGGDLVFSGLNGRVVAVRPPAAAGARPALPWQQSLGASYLYSRPASAGSLLFVGAMDGTLTALRVPTAPTPAVTMGSPGLVAAPPAAAFPDASRHRLAAAVGLAQALGLAKGYADGSFRPDAVLTRAELAVLQARYLGLTAPGKGFVSPFRDLRGHWAEPMIAALAEAGLVRGEVGPSGQPLFYPDRPASRAEAAQITARLAVRLSPSPLYWPELLDITGHWGADAIAALAEAGLLTGTLPVAGRFAPNQSATRAEAVGLLARLAIGRG